MPPNINRIAHPPPTNSLFYYEEGSCKRDPHEVEASQLKFGGVKSGTVYWSKLDPSRGILRRSISMGKLSDHVKGVMYRLVQRAQQQNNTESSCRLCRGAKDQLRERIQSLEAQVAADREQLAAKDRQIEELIRCAKKPRTETTHNHNVTNQRAQQQNNTSQMVYDDTETPEMMELRAQRELEKAKREYQKLMDAAAAKRTEAEQEGMQHANAEPAGGQARAHRVTAPGQAGKRGAALQAAAAKRPRQ